MSDRRYTHTEITADGLRYKSRVSGSMFSPIPSAGAAMLSCFLCGKHRSRAHLQFRKLIGRHTAVCAPSCTDLERKLKTGA